jgi:glucose-6-phosphate 1-dehydrogenase
MHLGSVEMQFNYQDGFAARPPDAYETLLWDVMKNDATFFMRADHVE